MIINAADTWKTAKNQHTIYLNSVIRRFLEKPADKLKSALSQPFVRLIRNRLTSHQRADMDITVQWLLQIKNHVNVFEYNHLIDDLKHAFNYTYFSKKEKPGWNAYSLCRESKLKICPYCHHAYAFTVFKGEDGSLRPTLDHFYPKSLYPHLALTLCNLIPSCYSCNSSLKGDDDVYANKHLHPYFDEETISFKITHASKTIVDIIGSFQKIKNELTIELLWPEDCVASSNSISLFALAARYEHMSCEGVDFIASQVEIEALLGNQKVIKNMPDEDADKSGGPLKIEDAYLKARLLRFERNEYKQYILGKMYADLYDQFHRGLDI